MSYIGFLTKLSGLPILRNHPDLSQLIPRPYLPTHNVNPILARCSLTLAESASTSMVNCGNGVA